MTPRRGDGLGRVDPDVPVTQARAHSGRWRKVRPRRTRRLAALRGTRQHEAIHAEAVLAPSAAHSSPTSKAAVASVSTELQQARRDAMEAFDGLTVGVLRSPRCHDCFERLFELV